MKRTSMESRRGALLGAVSQKAQAENHLLRVRDSPSSASVHLGTRVSRAGFLGSEKQGR